MDRLSSHHAKYKVLLNKQSSLLAGIGGEEQLEQLLSRHNFLFKHGILHDLQLATSESFQLDTTIITLSCAILFEVKNIAGTLEFKDNPPQLVRTTDEGLTDGFDSPLHN
ncbi:nuclease-related domain-containing protein [Bacillus carboniphilus]|uniref:nuclease-related domain-containing protein n=1 Tax=Bacillus carboniphilus TaxID=86663 RepID=UPI003CD05B4D